MIIFSINNRFSIIETGEFYCPNCQQKRPYEWKRGKRYFALYFIPLIPMGDLGEFVECKSCYQLFPTDVLKQKIPLKALSVTELLNTVEKRLAVGEPIEWIVRDLTLAQIERDVAERLVQTYVGDTRATCATCCLSYAPHINHCTECYRPLDTAQRPHDTIV